MEGATESRVVVTGANGFVGQGLCRRLMRDGHTVLGSVRSAQAARYLPEGTTPVMVRDVHSVGAWEAVFSRGVSAVVHLIARAHHTEDGSSERLEKEYRHVNVDITKAVVEACWSADIRQLVYVSSIKVAGEGRDRPYAEDDEPCPTTVYGRTKLEAEHVVGEFGGPGRRVATIMRPPLVYGRGVQGNFERLVSWIRRGVPLPLGLVRARRGLIALENLCDAAACAIDHPGADGTFHVADSEELEVRELVRRLGDAVGRRARLVPVPLSLLDFSGRLLWASAEVHRLTSPLRLSTEKIKSALGWYPPLDVNSALRRAVGGDAT